MKISEFGRWALCAGVAAALLVGCGTSQPLAAPGLLPQSRTIATRANSSNYRIVYTFRAPPDGSEPKASLIDVGGTLYGATKGGGSAQSCSYVAGGTVFSVTPGGKEKVIHSFAGDGTDGCTPAAALINVGGTLYGTTTGGGMYGCGIYSGYNYDACGTVFSITPGGNEKVLHFFGNYGSRDGDYPTAPLIDVKGTLYGTTSQGGSDYCKGSGYPYHCGTVFTVTTAGSERVLYDFRKGVHGHFPLAGLIAVGGTLYGTTNKGGSYACGDEGCGTVFSVTPGGKVKILHTFGSGSDGRYPKAGLVNLNGILYGTTVEGGANNDGTVFSITTAGTESVLHSFDNTDGRGPSASLIAVKGTLYGTTYGGGADGAGTVFSVSTTGEENVLHSFSYGSDGSVPYASLLNVKGTLYGTTSGNNDFDGYGTVFALTP